ELPLLLLGLRRQQVLEGVVHDAEVRAHEAYALERTDADLEMILAELDVLVFVEDPFPLLAGAAKEGIDTAVGDLRVLGLLEFNDLALTIDRFFLVPDFCEDQLKDLIELVGPRIGENQFFEVLDDFLKVEIPIKRR